MSNDTSDFDMSDHLTTDATTGSDSFENDDGTTVTVDRGDIHEHDATLPHADRVYANEDGSDTADDIDPRLLHRNPTVDEIRWHARMNGVASTIIEKPIRDAFKNAFDLYDDGQLIEDHDDVHERFDEWIEVYKEAQTKARRDGPAAIFYKLKDANDINQPPENVQGLAGMEIMTLDKWEDGGINYDNVIEGYDFLDDDEPLHNIQITDDGLVVYRNISSAEHHRKLLGYCYRENDSPHGTQFIHADRCQHFAWNTKNDGRVDEFTVGEYAGDSVLLPIYIPLKSLTVSHWAKGQTVFRYSAPLYAVETPEGYDQDEFDAVDEQVQNLNSASDITLPPGCSIDTAGNKGSLNPEPYDDKLIEHCCAGTEFTKSVLLGTQTGTVSGSSTDIKNYFNQVQRFRHGDGEADIYEWFEMMDEWGLLGIDPKPEIDWGALFKMDSLDRTQSMVSVTQAASQAIENYILEPNEARELLEQQWAELDVDIDLGDLSDEEFEDLIEMYGEGDEDQEEPDGNPQMQNGGGMEQGQTTDPNDPT